MKDTATPSPILAPPGAGIPTIERVVGGMIFALNRWRGTRENFAAQFREERGAIAALRLGLSDRVLKERVLIPRLRGLEDSSRFWSVWMTLDHLRIVNNEVTRVIEAIARGQTPHGRASTAAVKPSPDVGAEVVGAYEESCEQFLIRTGAFTTLRTSLRFEHPWFGPLDGAGWHALAAMHMGIHRAQIARIIAEPASKTP